MKTSVYFQKILSPFCIVSFIAAFAVLAVTAPAHADIAACDALDGEKAETAKKLLGEIRPYECCDDTVAKCLEDETDCSLVPRLAADICRLVAEGRDENTVRQAIRRRAQSMMPTLRPANIDIDEATRAGDADAPVLLVMYACTTCPFCYAIASDLHDLVSEGALSGKVRLYYRSFPLRDHENSVEGGLALTAAAKMGKFWPMARIVYERIKEFTPDKAVDWAESTGLDREEFKRIMNDSKTRTYLGESRREGMQNRVNSTPTFFINGRRYSYETTIPVFEDVLMEEYERLKASSESGNGDTSEDNGS